jgi:hypothetical protein
MGLVGGRTDPDVTQVLADAAAGDDGAAEGDFVCFLQERGSLTCAYLGDPGWYLQTTFSGDDLVIRDGVVYGAPPTGPVPFIDLNVPAPVQAEVCGTNSGPRLVLDGDRGYIAPNANSLVALDLGDTGSPTIAAAWPMPTMSGTLFDVRDETLYWLDPDLGALVVIDLTCGATPCPADVDANGAVDIGDLLSVLSAWGPCP